MISELLIPTIISSMENRNSRVLFFTNISRIVTRHRPFNLLCVRTSLHVRVSSNAPTSVSQRAEHGIYLVVLNRAEWRGGGGGGGGARFSYGQSGNPTRSNDMPSSGGRSREGEMEEEKKDLIRFPLEFTWHENKGSGIEPESESSGIHGTLPGRPVRPLDFSRHAGVLENRN